VDLQHAELLSGKKTAYAEYRKLRDEAQELLIAQSNIGSIYDFSDGKFRRQEEKEQKRRWNESQKNKKVVISVLTTEL